QPSALLTNERSSPRFNEKARTATSASLRAGCGSDNSRSSSGALPFGVLTRPSMDSSSDRGLKTVLSIRQARYSHTEAYYNGGIAAGSLACRHMAHAWPLQRNNCDEAAETGASASLLPPIRKTPALGTWTRRSPHFERPR